MNVIYTDDFLKNKKYNALSYVRFSHRDEKSVPWAIWKCDCGTEISVRAPDVVKGNKKSCNCFRYRTKSQNPNWGGFGELSGNYWYVVLDGAKSRNFKVEITIEDAWNLFVKQKGKCALTGVEIKIPNKSKKKDYTASLDRIDSSKGYLHGNVQWVHKDLNRMKMNMNESVFKEWCRKVTEYESYDQQ